MKPSLSQRAFNATAAGQRAMCDDAGSRANAFQIARILRAKGIATYDDAFIASASGATLDTIKEELLNDYNTACGKK